MARAPSPIVASITRADLRLLISTAHHCKTIVTAVKSADLKHQPTAVCEAMRLLRTKDVPALIRKLEVWNTLAEQLSTGSPETVTTSHE